MIEIKLLSNHLKRKTFYKDLYLLNQQMKVYFKPIWSMTVLLNKKV
jgi:hypothetical protein